MRWSCAASLELIVSLSLPVTACRRRHFAPRVNQTPSGRFAKIDNGLGFQLVPWRPALEQRLERQVSGVVTARVIDWDFARKRGFGL